MSTHTAWCIWKLNYKTAWDFCIVMTSLVMYNKVTFLHVSSRDLALLGSMHINISYQQPLGGLIALFMVTALNNSHAWVCGIISQPMYNKSSVDALCAWHRTTRTGMVSFLTTKWCFVVLMSLLSLLLKCVASLDHLCSDSHPCAHTCCGVPCGNDDVSPCQCVLATDKDT